MIITMELLFEAKKGIVALQLASGIISVRLACKHTRIYIHYDNYDGITEKGIVTLQLAQGPRSSSLPAWLASAHRAIAVAADADRRGLGIRLRFGLVCFRDIRRWDKRRDVVGSGGHVWFSRRRLRRPLGGYGAARCAACQAEKAEEA